MDMYVPDGFRGDDVDDEEVEIVEPGGIWKCRTCGWQLANVEFDVAGREHNRTQNCAFRCLGWENLSIKNDPVNHPLHYNFGKFEVIDVLVDWKMDFLLGNVIKYVARAGRKGSKSEDLKKARVYLERAILEAEVEEAKLA